MCGIHGVITKEKALAANSADIGHFIQRHRGPDMKDNVLYDVHHQYLQLAHQRLSILDLSESGRQPMTSHSGESAIVFNGEVYNYKELAKDLALPASGRGSDTEVILEVLEKFDVADAFAKFNGMWAIAFYDKLRNKLVLSRDRAGIKPLYYTFQGSNFFFASEIKTLLKIIGKKFRLNYQIIGEYLEQSLQDTSNQTFFDGIYSVPAGSYTEIDLTKPFNNLEFKHYWQPFKDLHYSGNPYEEFKSLFYDSVRLRLRSDVPIGVTLSGGLDSSTITAAMCDLLDKDQPRVALSVVSPGEKNDESKYVDIVAKHYSLDMNKIELNLDPKHVFSMLGKVTYQNDSPLGNFSNVAHYMMMDRAHDIGIKVILSGQGADELLCGYKKYLGFYIQTLLRSGRYLDALKTLSAFATNGTILPQFNLAEAKRYLPKLGHSVKSSILTETVRDVYKSCRLGVGSEDLRRRQWADYESFSVPFLNHYEDRMSMAFSREIRLPFLDYRLVEFLLNTPDELKIHGGWTKYILRQSFSDKLPDSIVWRKDKQGFVNPQDQWLKVELKSNVEEIFLKDSKMFSLGLVDHSILMDRFDRYCSEDKSIWYRDIFNPLAFEIWLREFEDYIE